VPKGQICCSNTDDIKNEITIDIGYGERKSPLINHFIFVFLIIFLNIK
jgi:hypothetical protein